MSRKASKSTGSASSSVVNIRVNKELSTIDIAQTSSKKKKFKRKYVFSRLDEFPIRGDAVKIPVFRAYLIKLLMERGNVTKSKAEEYTGEAGMRQFILAMSHDSVTPNVLSENYEMYEHLGDSTVNHITTWYLSRRFPEIVQRGNEGVSIISLQKNLLTSKLLLNKYCEEIGLSKFVLYRPLPYIPAKEDVYSGKHNNITLDESMKEDAFEALFGCLENLIDNTEGMIGLGNAICYSIMASIYDNEYIPTTKDELVDNKTKLKEIFDKLKKDKILYIYNKDKKEVKLTLDMKDLRSIVPTGYESKLTEVLGERQSVIFSFGPLSTIISGSQEESDTNKQIMEQKLAGQALEHLKTLGVTWPFNPKKRE